MKKLIPTILILSILLLPSLAFAQSVISLPNPLAAGTFEDLIDTIINWLLVITAPIVGLLIVYAGFQYIFAGLSPEKQKESVNIIKYALLGYGIILLSKVLIAVVTGLFS